MDLNEAMQKHQELWFQLSEANIDDFVTFNDMKKRYIKETGILNNCYLCEVSKVNICLRNCDLCPCMEVHLDGCLNGIYEEAVQFFERRNKELFKKASIEIANLPVVNKLYLKE